MRASVHLADTGFRTALSVLRKAPAPEAHAGLRHADVAIAAPLGPKLRNSPQLGRVALVAFWDDDDAIDGFLDAPLARKLAGGWSARLEPLRVHGSWPGVDDDLPKSRAVEHDGPAVVLTLGRLRLTRALPFFRTSAKAEGAVLDAPGLIWATGLARPPFVSTCSLWESAQALSDYAYGSERPAHPGAITADRAKPFHHQSAFIRFRPYASEGRLDGRNPLSASLGV